MVGNRTRVKVVKNKVAPPFKQAEFDIMYGKGISREGGLIDVGVEAGLVRKAGAWYTYEGDQLGQGKENARGSSSPTTPTWPTSWRSGSWRSSGSARPSTPGRGRERPTTCPTSRSAVDDSLEAWTGDGRGAGSAPGRASLLPTRSRLGPDADAESVARTILLDALTGQARSRHELRDKLAKKQVPDELAERLLDRFTEVGLVDDDAVRPVLGGEPTAQPRAGAARAGPGAAAQGRRRRDRPRGARRPRPGRRGAAARAAGPQEAALAARRRPRHRDPAAGGDARLARATRRVWPSRWSATSSARLETIRHDGRVNPHLHRLPPGPVDLTAIATDATPGFDGGKTKGKAALFALGDELSDLQERLWAERTTGSQRRVLLVLQGMDTSGKGGVLRHTVGLVDPQGVKITSFKAPTDEERQHHFLWRIRNALPAAGLHRGLRPVPLRGRPDRPGARPGRAGARSRAATTRSTSSRPSWPPRAW